VGCSSANEWERRLAKEEAQRAKRGLAPFTEREKALRYKFRDLNGGELLVDAFGEKNGVDIYDETGRRFFGSAIAGPRNRSRLSFGAQFGVPVTLRATWWDRIYTVLDENLPIRPANLPREAYWGRNLIGDYTVAVADRVSEGLLQELRTNGGGFRLLIRLHDEGLLVGWDIARRPGFDQKKFDAGWHFPEEYSYMEGDFHPARINNGKVVTPGWYIHPRTKERIETDF
jgi:hypothetical protein